MNRDATLRQRWQNHLRVLYGNAAGDILPRLIELVERTQQSDRFDRGELWNEQDVALITYADQVRREGESPLRTLASFLTKSGLSDSIRIVHLLPFFPSSSDDGFSVIDYRRVDPEIGDWADVVDLGRSFDLMFDLVLNHCSRESRWFQQALAGTEPYSEYFIEPETQADLTTVTRPRSGPLLTPFPSTGRERRFWTTFSDDQIDLNFANPDVLLEMISVLLFYVEKGARVIRLDAIAYLWKEAGTDCIHLPQTHAVVKLMRDVLDAVAPGTILLTETNVPHDENVSYFGEGNEAQMVYQFSLGPLLLDAFLNGDAAPFVGWLTALRESPPGTTTFNFTASHDGVGLRPLEGLVSAERLELMVHAVRERGGRVSMKRNPDGTESPYELNTSYFSALGETKGMPRELHVRRFLSTQAIMLALRGIPGIYFHSLVATPNDIAGVDRSGRARSINRRKFARDELLVLLAEGSSAAALTLDGSRKLLAARTARRAFHPNSPQQVFACPHRAMIAFSRGGGDFGTEILVLTNVGSQPLHIDLVASIGLRAVSNIVTGEPVVSQPEFRLAPFATYWLEVDRVTASSNPISN